MQRRAVVHIKKNLCRLAWVACLVVVGLGISGSVSAQTPFNKKKAQHFKARYKQQASHAPRACEKLSRKRNETKNIRVAAPAARKPKFRPMAEVDPPGFAREELVGPVVATAPAQTPALRERR